MKGHNVDDFRDLVENCKRSGSHSIYLLYYQIIEVRQFGPPASFTFGPADNESAKGRGTQAPRGPRVDNERTKGRRFSPYVYSTGLPVPTRPGERREERRVVDEEGRGLLHLLLTLFVNTLF